MSMPLEANNVINEILDFSKKRKATIKFVSDNHLNITSHINRKINEVLKDISLKLFQNKNKSLEFSIRKNGYTGGGIQIYFADIFIVNGFEKETISTIKFIDVTDDKYSFVLEQVLSCLLGCKEQITYAINS